ncbi:hypothetical protein [Candidatus Venteria ishoeyi]|uniref:Uncharacterized protein n=1 Tax=Candidatus Venteria ishoeyi TaxID=1899563 RepID=A0A1H6FAW2_9GAMM|nr:hypothetical protein [Candidatus Venteria ishoeyi]SEH06511.1 Uncharacterised protein [Candidatus Venteria ishoeyi]
MKTGILKYLFWLTLFAVAMAFLEGAVVVYLRELYYPEGFQFPLRAIEKNIVIVEILREAATMIMLLSVAILAGKKGIESFAWFIYSFAIWDIFYYVFLYFLVDWPQSLLEWDILFLIPVTWVGPVIAPVINSIMMIGLAMTLLYFSNKSRSTIVGWLAWLLLIVGSIVVIASYILDYVNYMQEWFSLSEIFFPKNSTLLLEKASQYIPQKFNWFIYGLGVFMHLMAIISIYQKNSKN